MRGQEHWKDHMLEDLEAGRSGARCIPLAIPKDFEVHQMHQEQKQIPEPTCRGQKGAPYARVSGNVLQDLETRSGYTCVVSCSEHVDTNVDVGVDVNVSTMFMFRLCLCFDYVYVSTMFMFRPCLFLNHVYHSIMLM